MVLITAVVLVACGASTGAQQPSVSVSGNCDAQYVTSTDAVDHMGQEVTVCGEVKDYFYINTGPAPTLLLVDEGGYIGPWRAKQMGIPEHPNSFSVVIWKKNLTRFPANVGSFYSGKVICTTGVVETYRDKPVIVASTPDQIKVGC